MIRNNIYESAWTQKAQGNGREVAMATNICKRFKSPQKTSKTTFDNRRLDTSILGSPFRYISKKDIHIIRKRTALTQPGGMRGAIESAAPACGELGRVVEHPFKICQTLSENLSLQQPRAFRPGDPDSIPFYLKIVQNRIPNRFQKSLDLLFGFYRFQEPKGKPKQLQNR